MITSEESNVCWVLKLQAEQELECFNWVVTSIDEISHENVACVGDLTSLIEKLQQVMELTMDITTNSNRGTHWLNIALFNKDLFNLLAEDSEISFRKDATVFNSL